MAFRKHAPLHLSVAAARGPFSATRRISSRAGSHSSRYRSCACCAAGELEAARRTRQTVRSARAFLVVPIALFALCACSGKDQPASASNSPKAEDKLVHVETIVASEQ